MCLDGLWARYRRNHGEIAVYGHIIGEIMAEVAVTATSRPQTAADRCVFKVLSAYARVARGGRLALRGANQQRLSVGAGVRGPSAAPQPNLRPAAKGKRRPDLLESPAGTCLLPSQGRPQPVGVRRRPGAWLGRGWGMGNVIATCEAYAESGRRLPFAQSGTP